MDDIGDDTVNEYIVKIIHAKVELANLKKRKNLILQEVHRQFLESEADPKKRIKSIKDIKIKNAKILNKVEDYSVANVSEKVLRIIYSYTDYVNQFIWKKFDN